MKKTSQKTAENWDIIKKITLFVKDKMMMKIEEVEKRLIGTLKQAESILDVLPKKVSDLKNFSR